jgi:hypothetical protein
MLSMMDTKLLQLLWKHIYSRGGKLDWRNNKKEKNGGNNNSNSFPSSAKGQKNNTVYPDEWWGEGWCLIFHATFLTVMSDSMMDESPDGLQHTRSTSWLYWILAIHTSKYFLFCLLSCQFPNDVFWLVQNDVIYSLFCEWIYNSFAWWW